ncbi:hypothetical protein ACHAWF_017043 [Thalassiosira exigua]
MSSLLCQVCSIPIPPSAQDKKSMTQLGHFPHPRLRLRPLVAGAIIIQRCLSLSLSSRPWPRPTVPTFPERQRGRRLHASVGNDDMAHSTQVSEASARLDPLLTSFLLRSVRSDAVDDPDAEPAEGSHPFTFSDASQAMLGLRTWEPSLRKARLPLVDDFPGDRNVWPDEPLFTRTCGALSELGVARLVRRHPEILTSVLLGVAKLVIKFIKAQRRGKLVLSEHEDEETYESDDTDNPEYQYYPLSADELDRLADSLTENLKQEWGGVAKGVAMLDKVFGYDHGLLDVQGEGGFGVQDGIWQHSGWEPVQDLQRKISSLIELRHLLLRLGRRQSAKGRDIRRFRQRRRSNSPNDMIGVELDQMEPTSLSGIHRSDSLASMLPSEAVLLCSSVRHLRLLFLAKKAESKLLSYELSTWTDTPTLPLPRSRRSALLPSAPGGPIIICLDTSHSMSGVRESLSKAVVLSSVTAAHAQGRDCRVVSFSSVRNAVEAVNITCSADGLRRLLDFLSYSFGGGTDVTGALKFAMEVLENDLASSDVLLVTDGEIPNPPVSKSILARLEGLKQETGMEIHGLLVGKKESESLDLLCTEVHDFLGQFEATYPYAGRVPLSPSALSLSPSKSRPNAPWFCRRPPKARFRFSLHAVSRPEQETVRLDSTGFRLNRRGEKSGTKRRRHFDEDNDDWDSDENFGMGMKRDHRPQTEKPEYVQLVEDAIEMVQDAALESICRSAMEEPEQVWSKGKILIDTISILEKGLVERDVEARLVVLGMVSQEHVLFIGPPGTSKSEIGRRLSQLCGGPFFQRLFTRFTTQEEIFGPLSLHALENDSYIRCIDGYLPTATVAFLDEIFKANSAILNTLLTILNERKFDNGAGNRVSCPLKCVIGASNELPESEELDALLDRFLLRSYVTSVSDDGLLSLLSAKSPLGGEAEVNLNISGVLDDAISEISMSLDTVSVGQNICVLFRDLRSFLRDELGLYVSDRRLVKASRLLKVSAASHGRQQVDLIDCLLLQHVMWQIPEHRDVIKEWLWDNLTPGRCVDLVEQTNFLLQGLAAESLDLVKKTMGDVTGDSGARQSDIEAINSIKRELGEIETLLLKQSNDLHRHMRLLENLHRHLWIGQDEANAAKVHLLPLANKASAVVNEALLNTTSLTVALSDVLNIKNELRSSVIEAITNAGAGDVTFTSEELQMSLKEAKRQYKGDLLRKWKAARKEM